MEKLRHDRRRLRDGIEDLRDNPREAYYAAYDLLTTAHHLAEDWLDLDRSKDRNGHFCLASDVANGVKHEDRKTTKEETYDEGNFSMDFSRDFDTNDLYVHVTEEEARKAEKGAESRRLDPQGIVQGQGMARELKRVSVLALTDRLIKSLEQEIQEGST